MRKSVEGSRTRCYTISCFRYAYVRSGFENVLRVKQRLFRENRDSNPKPSGTETRTLPPGHESTKSDRLSSAHAEYCVDHDHTDSGGSSTRT
ncbi:hypothetical protein AVEN_225104-1 [Araneus ventricosus]|uniref:Uncharacterized protein n=1 Tax=Araneus ventricosus TaxID=182803 RepID=A0A4Y2ICI5_ARAVE|nr:hypothetical protein AVEN_225104-1 [Araneus ventricosus]